MADNQTMATFYQNFMEEVLFAADKETSGWTTEDFIREFGKNYL